MKNLHRNSQTIRQFKAMKYLNNVDGENGPFTYVKLLNNKRDTFRSLWLSCFKPAQYSFTDEEVGLDCIRKCVLLKVLVGFYTGAFLFFNYLYLKLIIENHEIKKKQANFGFHVALSRCINLFAQIKS